MNSLFCIFYFVRCITNCKDQCIRICDMILLSVFLISDRSLINLRHLTVQFNLYTFSLESHCQLTLSCTAFSRHQRRCHLDHCDVTVCREHVINQWCKIICSFTSDRSAPENNDLSSRVFSSGKDVIGCHCLLEHFEWRNFLRNCPCRTDNFIILEFSCKHLRSYFTVHADFDSFVLQTTCHKLNYFTKFLFSDWNCCQS